MSGPAKNRPRQPRLHPSSRYPIAARVRTDERFMQLRPRTQRALIAAIEQRMGGHGWFWWKREEWGRAIGVSPRTVSTIVKELVAVGLITREPFNRPPGGEHGGMNAAPTFRLDKSLLGRFAAPVRLERAS